MNNKQMERIRTSIAKLNSAGINELRNSTAFLHMSAELQQLVRDRVNCYLVEAKIDEIIAAGNVEY